jgi:hypothetical protein
LILGLCVAGALAGSLASAHGRGIYLLVHDNGAPNQVWRFRFNANGSLDNLGAPDSTQNSDFALSGLADSAAYSHKANVLVTAGGSGVSSFRVGTDGSMRLTSGSPFGPQAEMQSVAVAEIGKSVYVYASEPASDAIHIYRVLPNGSLEAFAGDSGIVLVPGGPTGIRVVKNQIFFGTRDGKSIGCTILKDGTLRPIPGYTKTGLPAVKTVTPDPKAKSLYVADSTAPQLFGYKLNGKTATTLPNAPYAAGVTSSAGLGGLALGVGKYLFAFAPPNGGTADIVAYTRASSGALTAAGTAQSSGLPALRGGVVDPSGRFLMVVDDVADQLKSFSINPKTGMLTLVDTENAAFGDDDVNGMVFAQP